MTNPSQITKYIEYLNEELKKIGSIDNVLYKKLLLVTLLDSIARSKYPKGGNKERFVNFVFDCGEWENSQRVSIFQLYYYLEKQQSSSYNDLKDSITKRTESFETGRIYNLDVDPLYEDLIRLNTSQDEKELISNFRHSILLYKYRNCLVHEFREPGYGMEFINDRTTPYYHGMSSLENIDTWELVYPIGFFVDLAQKSLRNLAIFFEKNDLDPFVNYEFGTLWR